MTDSGEQVSAVDEVPRPSQRPGVASVVLSPAESALDVRNDEFGLCEVNNAKTVSYTHLTLPTNREV